MNNQQAEEILIRLFDLKVQVYLTGEQDNSWSPAGLIFWNSANDELKSNDEYLAWLKELRCTRAVIAVDYGIADFWYSDTLIGCASHWAFHFADEGASPEQENIEYFRASHMLAKEGDQWKVKHLQATPEPQPLLFKD